jgi:hypothetical protein
MYLWRRTAGIRWVKAHEELLQARAHDQLVIVRRPPRERLQVEIVCSSGKTARALVIEFGGRVEELPHNWFERSAR